MIKNDINTVLCDMGILVPDDNNDIDLSEYIIDSLQFISFIVEIENKFGIEIPDELLNIENLKSLNGFSQLIENILGERRMNNAKKAKKT